MSEPMRLEERRETDEVRAAGHASWPARGTRVGGEGYAGAAGAGDSSHSDSSDGTQVLSSWWWKSRMNANARSVCLGCVSRKMARVANNRKVNSCVSTCAFSNQVFGSEPRQSTPLARHKTGSWHKRMGGLTASGHWSQSRSQHRTQWRGRKFTSTITLLCLLWPHSQVDQEWPAPQKFRSGCLLHTMNEIMNSLDTIKSKAVYEQILFS